MEVKNYHTLVEEYKLKLINDALEETDNNKSKAAKLLNMNRTTLLQILIRDKRKQGKEDE